jgi:membrane protein DedA with SNARE-associated domain
VPDVWLDAWHGLWPYLVIAAGAAIEGEALYSGAAVLVGLGRLDPLPVLLAGAAGASLGDQFYFYLLRGRLRGLIDRLGPDARRRPALVAPVRRPEWPSRSRPS